MFLIKRFITDSEIMASMDTLLLPFFLESRKEFSFQLIDIFVELK